MVPQARPQEETLPSGTFCLDAYLIGQLANWIIDQISEIERRNGSDWHETRRNEDFWPKFVKMG